MTTDPWGRYSSTQQFLAELDDERAGPIADEDNLGALDLDQPLAGEPGDDEPGYDEPDDHEPGYDEPGWEPTDYTHAGDADVPEDPRTTSFGVAPSTRTQTIPTPVPMSSAMTRPPRPITTTSTRCPTTPPTSATSTQRPRHRGSASPW